MVVQGYELQREEEHAAICLGFTFGLQISNVWLEFRTYNI